MGQYSDIHPGEAVPHTARRENDISHLLNRMNGFRGGAAAPVSNVLKVQVCNKNLTPIPAGAPVNFMDPDDDVEMVDAIPCAAFFAYWRKWGILTDRLGPNEVGGCIVSGPVKLDSVEGDAGDRVMPWAGPEGPVYRRGSEGAPILYADTSGVVILLGDRDDGYRGYFKVALTYMTGEEGEYGPDEESAGSSESESGSSSESSESSASSSESESSSNSESESSAGESSADSSAAESRSDSEPDSEPDSDSVQDSSGDSGEGSDSGGGQDSDSSSSSSSGSWESWAESSSSSGWQMERRSSGMTTSAEATCHFRGRAHAQLPVQEFTNIERADINCSVTLLLWADENLRITKVRAKQSDLYARFSVSGEPPDGGAELGGVSFAADKVRVTKWGVIVTGGSENQLRVKIQISGTDSGHDETELPEGRDVTWQATGRAWAILDVSLPAGYTGPAWEGESSSSSGGAPGSGGSPGGGSGDGSSGADTSEDDTSDSAPRSSAPESSAPEDSSGTPESSAESSRESSESSVESSSGSSESSEGSSSSESSESSESSSESSENGSESGDALVLAVFDGADPTSGTCGFADFGWNRTRYPRTKFTNWRQEKTLYVYISGSKIRLAEAYPYPAGKTHRLLARLVYRNGAYLVVQEQYGPVIENYHLAEVD